MASQPNHQTLGSGSFTERSRPRRNDSFSETPVKTRQDASSRLPATPMSARQHRPASRGLTSQSSRVPVETPLPLRTPRRVNVRPPTPAAPKPKAESASSPPDSPRSTEDFSTFSDADWEDNLSNNVKVITRIRPPSQKEMESGEENSTRCATQSGARVVALATHRSAQPYEFPYDHVAGELSTQDDMFMLVGHPIVENCLAGYNSSIFAYGQTGAGKTYTMSGQLGSSDQRGLAPRVFEHIFKRITEEEDNAGRDQLRFSVKCSFLEIYNENITDLLKPASGSLTLREDMKRGCYVDGLTEQNVLNVEDALNVMRRGTENRRIGETDMNQESSRSHSVFTCIMESSSKGEDGFTRVKFSRLNLVDLAGSERNKASGATGDHFREACSINKSLTCLGRVIMELVEAQRQGRRRTHIPYRDSRLTFLLQDSLGGNAKTMIIANISPCHMCAQETLSTLQFASRAKHIRNKAVINLDTSGDVALLQKEIIRLRRELTIAREGSTEPLVREISDLQEKLKQLEQAKVDWEDCVALTRSEVRKYKEQAEWNEKKLAIIDSEQKAQEQAQQAAQQQLEKAHQDQIDALWQRLETQKATHADAVQQLQQQLDSAAAAHEEDSQALQQQLSTASANHAEELQQLQQQAEDMSREHAREVQQLQQGAEQLSAKYREEVAQLQEQQAMLEAAVQEKTSDLMQMQASTEAQQAEHAAQVTSMSTEAEQLQSLVRQLTEQDQQRLTDLEGQKADASNLRQQVQELQGGLADSQASNAHLKTQSASMQHKAAEEISHLQTQLQSTQGQLQHSQTHLADTETQLEQSQAQLADTQSQVADTQTHLRGTEQELADTHSQLQQAQAQLHATQAQLAHTVGQLEESQSLLADEQAELARTQTQLAETQSQLGSRDSQLREAQASASRMHTEYQNQKEASAQVHAQLQQAVGLEKQSNAQLANSMRQLRRDKDQLLADAAGRERMYKDENKELKKALHHIKQDLKAAKKENNVEFTNRHEIMSLTATVSSIIQDIVLRANNPRASRQESTHEGAASPSFVSSYCSQPNPWDPPAQSPITGATASTSVYQAAVQEDDSTATSGAVRGDVDDHDTENTAPGGIAGTTAVGPMSPKRMHRKLSFEPFEHVDSSRASVGSTGSTPHSSSVRTQLDSRPPPLQTAELESTGGVLSPLSPQLGR